MNGTITKNMNGYVCNPEKIIYKVVLTGGPCAGKTTGQSRLCSFFENLGWEVYRVPETASVLLGGGVKFENMNKDQAFFFQESVLKTLIQIEDCFFSLGEMSPKNCLVVCDRGTMDPSAFLHPDEWEKLMQKNNLNPVYLRDTRYHQIIHLMSAAIGAEEFYSTDNNSCRKENVDLARYLDKRAAQAWVGHPYFDVINNSTDFDTKIRRMIDAVCQRIGIDTGDRLNISARKRKFLINDPLPTDSVFPPFEDFNVHHIYLKTNPKGMQIRIRKRGKNGHFSYTHTCRKAEKLGQIVEVKTPIGLKEWNNMQAQADEAHLPIYKKRRCFLYNDQYFQLDIYEEPCHRRCKKLILLETYSTLNPEELENRLPDFLQVVKDVTGEPKYSMFNLSLLSEEDEMESSFEN